MPELPKKLKSRLCILQLYKADGIQTWTGEVMRLYLIVLAIKKV